MISSRITEILQYSPSGNRGPTNLSEYHVMSESDNGKQDLMHVISHIVFYTIHSKFQTGSYVKPPLQNELNYLIISA